MNSGNKGSESQILTSYSNLNNAMYNVYAVNLDFLLLANLSKTIWTRKRLKNNVSDSACFETNCFANWSSLSKRPRRLGNKFSIYTL